MENYNLAVPQMSVSEIKSLAEQFVVQYYSMMNENPSNLHRFYIDKSSMVYDDLPSFGQQKIHEKFMQMDLKNTKVAVIQLDALLAHMNSVIIQVAGEISKANNEPRRFMQSFVLVEQSPNSLYVLNDIFRYQDKVFQDEIITTKHLSLNKENIGTTKLETFERTSFANEESINHTIKHTKPVQNSVAPNGFEKMTSEKHSTNGHSQSETHVTKHIDKNKLDSIDMNNTKGKNSLKEVINNKQMKYNNDSESKSWAQMASEGKGNPPASKGFQRNNPSSNNQSSENKKPMEPRQQNGNRSEGKQAGLNNNGPAKNNLNHEEGQRRPINFSRGANNNNSRGGRGGFVRRNVQSGAQASS